jgi:pseudouridine synthase
MKERIQKIIARAGIASRREAERMIDEGRVRVNGKTITEQGTSADAEVDHIKVDGKLLQLSNEYYYYLLNKPKGVVSTVSDPDGRPTVIDLMAIVKHRLFPVGRLDINTEGALLLTNDGDLANKLLKPAAKCPKTYLVKVAGIPDAKDIDRLQRGVTVDGMRYSRCEIRILKSDNNSWLTVVLHEGKNHQIKNMFESVGHPVSKLRRIGFAFMSLKGLETGQFRELSDLEVERLKKGDVNPLKPISPLRTLKQIGVETPEEKESRPRRKPSSTKRTMGNSLRRGTRSFGRDRDRRKTGERRDGLSRNEDRRGSSSDRSRDSRGKKRSERNSGSFNKNETGFKGSRRDKPDHSDRPRRDSGFKGRKPDSSRGRTPSGVRRNNRGNK